MRMPRGKAHGRPRLSRIAALSCAAMKAAKRPAAGARPEPAARMTTAQAAVAALVAHGIDTVYALPGVHNDHLFDALFEAQHLAAQNSIRTVPARHEQG